MGFMLSDKEQVQLQELLDKIVEIKSRFEKIREVFKSSPYQSAVNAIREKLNQQNLTPEEQKALRANLKEQQAILDSWNKFPTRLAHAADMKELLSPDVYGLDEDRCNWLMLGEEIDELEKELRRLEFLAQSNK
ncbi:MAG: hypothetical protein A2036_02995 [Omnitrophica bacterium GWA2_50_21]|nr:MAG: hypothetical protein A2036_02995 [Omnitrophica bacterium GWA2_50_21]